MSTPSPAARSGQPGRVLLLRHGTTEWSLTGRHTGSTDVPLTPAGEAQARALPPLLRALLDERSPGAPPALVATSPRTRARRTAELAGLDPAEVDEDLAEWDYGAYEGLTTPEIRALRSEAGLVDPGGWRALRDGVAAGAAGGPPGEDLAAVSTRAARVLARVAPARERGDVVLVAHGHLLRVLAAVWLLDVDDSGVQAGAGGADVVARVGEVASHLLLDTAAVCVLDSEHGVPGVRRWNLTAALL